MNLLEIKAKIRRGPDPAQAAIHYWSDLGHEAPNLVAEMEMLRGRLEAAEQVCVLYGWTSGGPDTDREKATRQAWSDWRNEYGRSERIDDWGDRIRELAQRRDELRRRTFAAICKAIVR